MNAEAVIAALDLPSAAKVNRRVPKSMLVRSGAPTIADKRRIADGIEDLYWVATLKPTTIGISAYRDSVREYLEIAVLSVALRPNAKAERLAELIHRAVPYPVVLLAGTDAGQTISLCNKRRSHLDAQGVVLDGDPLAVTLTALEPFGVCSVHNPLSLSQQPRQDLYRLYQGWIDTLLAVLAARVTGSFEVTTSQEQGARRQQALHEFMRLDAEIDRLRAVAAKEKQIARRVTLNRDLKSLELQRTNAKSRL